MQKLNHPDWGHQSGKADEGRSDEEEEVLQVCVEKVLNPWRPSRPWLVYDSNGHYEWAETEEEANSLREWRLHGEIH